MTEDELDEILSRPRAETVAAIGACAGNILILGAGGKMGPTLARMAARAVAHGGLHARVTAVSRFSSPSVERWLQDHGVETQRCDLLDAAAVAKLPDAENVIFMAGQKFGTEAALSRTWALNTVVPAYCAQRYSGRRIVVFSTGNVYALSNVGSGGAREADPPKPVGEYAMSVVGRERIFEHFADQPRTRLAIVRLNYAIDVRYGVFTDLALKILRDEPVPLSMSAVNVIWQGDANRIALECLARAETPAFVVNVTGRDELSIRTIALELGQRLGKRPTFSGVERDDALLSNTMRMAATFAPPEVSVEVMLDRVAEWIRSGGTVLNKPTRFEMRDGRF